MKAAVNLTIAMLKPDQVSEFMTDIEAKLPKFSATIKWIIANY